jgi:4-amino-4-deoxy-L-arabinose transferase-like glycosyltransferase
VKKFQQLSQLTSKISLGFVLLVIGYLALHVINLNVLPVFADEAIYIRWAQLIMDDWGQYLFFPLNDGKTPLFIWFLVPFQYVFSNQLLAARLVSVLIGLIQIAVLGWVTKLLGGKPRTIFATMVLTSILPFWFLHHRLALIDGLLTLWLSLALALGIKFVQSFTQLREHWLLLTGLGITFFLALLTKLPAILAFPSFFLLVFLPIKTTTAKRFQLGIGLGLALVLGGGLFSLLKLHPAFGQLFSRGSDFLYPWQDVLIEGAWRQTLPNLPTYFSYFSSYLTVPILILALAGLFLKPNQRQAHILWWSALLFILPIALLGKVVYPRYLLPAALFLTPAAMLAAEQIIQRWIETGPSLVRKVAVSSVVAMLMANTLGTSGVFIFTALINPNELPLVEADRTQYLTEWSSGHGLTQTVALINQKLTTGTLAVATEGYFGTLPDGLLMYFHRRPVNGLYLEGIGQPVAAIPTSFKEKAKVYDQTWLVVNSHRLKLPRTPDQKIAEYCRPYGAPCLQIWDITDLIKP